MDREGLSKIKRAEFLSRLELLERFIEEQEAHVAGLDARGRDAKDAKRRLQLLRESRARYLLALLQQLGDRSLEPEPEL